MNNIDDIKIEYTNLRIQHEREMEERKAKLYEEHKELEELDKQIISLYVKKAKLPWVLNSSEVDENVDKIRKIEEEIAEVRKKRKDYIEENGIIDNYNEIAWTCPKCKDTGFVGDEKCSCLIEKEINLFKNISNFATIMETDSFDKLDFRYYNQDITTIDGKMDYKEYMTKAVGHMIANIKNIKDSSYNAIFIGPTGTGKSFLAHCIGAEAIKENKSVLLVTANEFISSYFDEDKEGQLEDYMLMCDMLILEDMGLEQTGDFASSKMYYIIDKRLSDKKSTIITTNLSIQELSNRYFANLMSRISAHYYKYWLNGQDLRSLRRNKYVSK